MLLWHLGTAALIVYVSLGRRRVDYRFVLLGAVLPDVVDGGLALTGLVPTEAGRSIAHSLLAPLVVALAVVVIFGGSRRLAWFGVAVGWLIHIVGDGMWAAPRTFLWPAFGTEFATIPKEPYTWDLFIHPLAHVTTWAGELVGLLILVWFWIAHRLGEEDRFRRFLSDGYLRP